MTGLNKYMYEYVGSLYFPNKQNSFTFFGVRE